MPKDYLINYDTHHMQIRNGDFVLGDSTQQHQRSLLVNQPGAYKQYPLACVGIANYLDDESPDDMMRETRRQFVQDGMTVSALEVTTNGISVNAVYDY